MSKKAELQSGAILRKPSESRLTLLNSKLPQAFDRAFVGANNNRKETIALSNKKLPTQIPALKHNPKNKPLLSSEGLPQKTGLPEGGSGPFSISADVGFIPPSVAVLVPVPLNGLSDSATLVAGHQLPVLVSESVIPVDRLIAIPSANGSLTAATRDDHLSLSKGFNADDRSASSNSNGPNGLDVASPVTNVQIGTVADSSIAPVASDASLNLTNGSQSEQSGSNEESSEFTQLVDLLGQSCLLREDSQRNDWSMRMMLKEDIMKDTLIEVSRSHHLLRIEFSTTSHETLNRLAPRTEEIQGLLKDKTQLAVSVEAKLTHRLV
jgi:hypothetical protein